MASSEIDAVRDLRGLVDTETLCATVFDGVGLAETLEDGDIESVDVCADCDAATEDDGVLVTTVDIDLPVGDTEREASAVEVADALAELNGLADASLNDGERLLVLVSSDAVGSGDSDVVRLNEPERVRVASRDAEASEGLDEALADLEPAA